ncbi:MAG: flavodoxin family protein [Bacillota bacterium]|jgi:flavodoxin
MKTAIIYYTLSGKTRLWAEKAAQSLSADLFEVKEYKPKNFLTSFLIGCPQARRQKSTPLATPDIDLTDYKRIILAAPVWAGYPAPAFNSIINMLPANKEIEIALTSSSGKSSCREKVNLQIEDKNCHIKDWLDIKTK